MVCKNRQNRNEILFNVKVRIMNVDLITREDLERFKKELLEEIRRYQQYPRKQGQEVRVWLKSYEVRKLLGISAGTLQNLRLNGTLSVVQYPYLFQEHREPVVSIVFLILKHGVCFWHFVNIKNLG